MINLEKIFQKNDETYVSLINISFFLVLFGIQGLKVILGIIILFFLPSFLILKKIEMDNFDRIFIAALIGIGLFPTVVYHISMIVSSMRLSILIGAIILLTFGLFLNIKEIKSLILKND